MSITNVIIMIVGLIISTVGVTISYDARKITKKWFSYSDLNQGTKWLKIIGYLISVIGGCIIIVIMMQQ